MGMGMGDVKLLAMLARGSACGKLAWRCFWRSSWARCTGWERSCSSRQEDKDDQLPPGQLPVPFGTMLSLAGLYSIFLGQRTLGWYMQFFH